MNSGYDTALSLAYEKLASLSPEIVCEQSGARYADGEYYLKWLSQEKALSEADTGHKIVWLHYMTTQGVKVPSGRLLPYREVPGGAQFYNPNFVKRVTRPLTKTFGKDPDSLIKVGEAFGGKKLDDGDASIVINVLPYLPITYIIWRGDDELEPSGSVLFDQTAISWLCAEDLVAIAGYSVYAMIGYKYSKL
jgi:hypothetical protein